MYFDPTWIFDEKPPKTDYPNVTGLMGEKPKVKRPENTEGLTSLADVFTPIKKKDFKGTINEPITPAPHTMFTLPDADEWGGLYNKDSKILNTPLSEIRHTKQYVPSGESRLLEHQYDLNAKRLMRNRAEEARKDREGGKILLNDLRYQDGKGTHPVSGNPLNPNKHLYTGEYNTEKIRAIFMAAQKYNVDPWEALAIAMQESTIGNAIGRWQADHVDPDNVGHVGTREVWKVAGKKGYKIDTGYDMLGIWLENINNTYQELYKKLGITYDPSEEDVRRLQVWNGLGVLGEYNDLNNIDLDDWVSPKPTQYAYDVDITNKPLNMKENPAYGKMVVSYRDAFKQHPELIDIYNQVYGKKQ